MLVDSHCHLHDREFFAEEQAKEMIKRAHKKGVKKIVCIGTDQKDSEMARDFAASHDGVYWTYGIHPENSNNEQVEYGVLKGDSFMASSSAITSGGLQRVCIEPPVAIGEVGLDYHRDGYDREAQIQLFEKMIQLAIDNDLPVVFHVRNAFDDFLPVVNNFPKVRGVVHSFTDSKKNLRKILEQTDFFVGVNGLATYSTLPLPLLERIILETDAPFLTPVPFRGIINEPGYVFEVAQWLSGKLGVKFEEIEKETTRNAERLYRFQDTKSAA